MAVDLIRLRNKANGVVINVDEATADALGSGAWESADEPTKQTAAQKRAAAKAAKDAEAKAAAEAEAEAAAAAQAEADAKAAADAAAGNGK